MDIKTAYTRTFMTLSSIPINALSVKDCYFKWWQNVRENEGVRSLRLTKQGFEHVTEKCDVKKYDIKFSEKVVWTAQTLLWLDEFIDSPYFIDKKKITVFKEKKALELHLFAGDVHKFGMTKAMAQKMEQNNQ